MQTGILPRDPDFVGTTALLKRSIVLVVQFQLLKLGVDLVAPTLLSYSFIESAVPPPSLFFSASDSFCITPQQEYSGHFLGDPKILLESP